LTKFTTRNQLAYILKEKKRTMKGINSETKISSEASVLFQIKWRYRILMGKPESKRPLGRPRRMWVDNIKMDLRETGWDGMDWIDLAQDRDQCREYL
jgi:hypothetical protein